MQDIVDGYRLLNREIFTRLRQATVLAEQWRTEYNRVGLSARDYGHLRRRPWNLRF